MSACSRTGPSAHGLAADLERSRRGVAAAEAEQFARLQLIAELVASFPELRALLATDTATVRDFLADYRERHGHQGLLIALDPAGAVVARSDTFAPLSLPDVERTLAGAARRGTARSRLRRRRGQSAPCRGRGRRVWRDGVRGRARRFADRRSLGRARSATPWARTWWCSRQRGWKASSLPRSRLTWRTEADAPADSRARPRLVADRRALPGGRRHPRAGGSAPDRHPSVARSGAGALSQPAARTAGARDRRGAARACRQRLAGEVHHRAHRRARAAPPRRWRLATSRCGSTSRAMDEIGHLARTFNQMTAGLRERADMTKFVSSLYGGDDSAPARPWRARGRTQGDHRALLGHPRLHQLLRNARPGRRRRGAQPTISACRRNSSSGSAATWTSSSATPCSRTSPGRTWRSTRSGAGWKSSAPSPVRRRMMPGCRWA